MSWFNYESRGDPPVIHDPLCPDVGVFPAGEATARWRVWASRAKAVELVLDPAVRAERTSLEPEGRGYFTTLTPMPDVGRRYAYSLDGAAPRPDPASRWQPEGISTPSAVYFPERFPWDERGWSGIEREDLVLYEIHVGTFTREGTFDAIIPRIDTLREVGITAIELMPVAQFPGVRSWGYDGVHLFAPQHSYGGPEAFQRLINACHSKGMAVFLDVVYNHFGPDGNVLAEFGEYLTERYKTDWGPAVNYDGRGCDPVRALVLQNVRQWVRDYHIDGLRLDAADQIYDRSPRHILAEIAAVAHEEAEQLGRPVHVFAETDLNDAPRFLNPHNLGGYGHDGHWNDDFHHAVQVALTGETTGYYGDFADGPSAVANVFSEVFVNNGVYSGYRGRRHGTPATVFEGDRFVAFTQNHDQVGNRARSDRDAASLPPPALRLAAGLLLLAPRLPLLFMGQEYGETNPFPFFCDFQTAELVEAVREGRKAELTRFGWDIDVPDAFDPSTRDLAVLSWSWDDAARSGLRRLYQDLLRLRRTTPALRDFRHPRVRLFEPQLLEVIRGASVAPLPVLFNLGRSPRPFPEGFAGRTPSFRSDTARYGAIGSDENQPSDTLGPYEFALFGEMPTEV
jgi:maltooligosyltrehalose trehalohydrolase